MSSSKHSFHPALTVSNIKNHVSIILDMDTEQYSTWAELFKVHAKSHKVLHHIIPPAKGKEKAKTKDSSSTDDDDEDMWSTLDATVLSWIYATISNDLLHTIIEPDATSMEAWNRLRDIIQDNKHSRAVTLEHDFSTTQMAHYPNASAYCQRLKSLADQLRNVGAPMSDNRLVLQLVSGLTSAFRGVGTLIRQSDPLPPFYQARSMLTLEEAGMAKEAAMGSDSAMVAAAPNDDYDSSSVSAHTGHSKGQQGRKHQGGRKNSGGGRGNGGTKSGRGGSGGKSGRGNGGQGSGQQQQQGGQQQWSPGWPPYPQYPQWANRGPGVLGPRPQQAYMASSPTGQSTYDPTDIASAMHTMTLNPPDMS
ncbi:uncharacterized protein LOC130799300 [Amaranthus tricolor]|uniref:uncharacterized protein LOC130799300 n=1 Tax=Amaranthus tricolor TaxID=29722 RepID=UPI0025865233|nr:uncharacterized protein LOC130799300 [Amaranthus tricolor]